MAQRPLERTVQRWALVAACAPLVMLTGCPQQQAGASGKTAAQATAPAITSNTNTNGNQSGQMSDAAAQAAEAAKAAKVQQLINKVEVSYHSGVDNYRAGHLDAARLDFDSAVDLMLTSGLDLKTDPQLSDEFDHLFECGELARDGSAETRQWTLPVDSKPLLSTPRTK